MKINNKTLHKVIPEWDGSNKGTYFLLAQQMLRLMEQQGGLGLAANQIGKDVRMFVMRVKDPKVCFNPKIISESAETMHDYEGCLSYKGEYIPIDRPARIDVEYQTHEGESVTETLSGLEARCFMHELDHLNGITMYKRKSLNEQ